MLEEGNISGHHKINKIWLNAYNFNAQMEMLHRKQKICYVDHLKTVFANMYLSICYNFANRHIAQEVTKMRKKVSVVVF